jgi:hypothetical protein
MGVAASLDVSPAEAKAFVVRKKGLRAGGLLRPLRHRATELACRIPSPNPSYPRSFFGMVASTNSPSM